MAKKYKVIYELIFENNSKLRQGTTLYMDGGTSSEAINKIRGTNNLTSNVKDIMIVEIKED